MARLISLVETCCMCLNEKQWRRGCQNVSHNRSLGNFLFFELSKWHFRSSHSSTRKLSDAVRSYGSNMPDGSDFTEKLSLFMGYDGIQELIESGEGHQRCELDISCLDLEMACNEFPSITLGDSTSIELYDNASLNDQMSILLEESWKKYLPNTVYQHPNKSKNLHDECSSTESSLSNAIFSCDIESLDNFSAVTAVTPLKDKMALDLSFTKETSMSSNYMHSDVSASTEIFLDKSVRSILGITARLNGQLENSGFHTVRKLLHHYPRTYADLQNVHSAIDDGQYLILVGTVLSSRGIQAGFSLSFLEVIVGCEFEKAEQISETKKEDSFSGDKKTIYLHLKKFFRGSRFTYKPFLQSIQSKYNEGDRVYVSGKVKKMHASDHYEMREYTVDMLEEGEEVNAHLERRPYPLYPSKAGLKAGLLRDIILRVLKVVPIDIDPIPDCFLKEFNLPDLHSAYFGIHRPKDIVEADLARRRLIFDEFFYLQLARLFQMLETLGTRGEKEGLLDKYRNQHSNAVSLNEWSELTKKFLEALPYSLTPSQLNAVSEIIWDLKRPVPMNRLLQGDVGCGKTVVAFLACMEVIGCGFQAAFMVPTELLAIQHYQQFISLLENISDVQQKPSVALLTGSTSTRQSRIIRQGLQTGEIAMVIGTHSLIAEKVEFSALRIAVVDEQHRFGVIQRGRFNNKLYSAPMKINNTVVDESSTESTDERSYMAPHVLAMSATPIPRTLALALYGDMSLTQITDLLPGRVSVETFALEGNQHGFEKVYQMMRDELVGGGKVYLVYPVIEESEQLPQLRAVAADFESISAKFKDYQCGILHGRMKSEEKDEALRMFRAGDIRILLATQVIEIGIDIPDASMMVVMNAEKFGIAQLHQLRGRVGRGEKQSKCVFLSSTAGTLGRLKVLQKSSDGFFLANVDLMHRGPGNLLGKKQSGHLPDFPIARLEIDGNILQEAHVAALKVLSASSDLDKFPRLKAELSMRQPLCLLGD